MKSAFLDSRVAMGSDIVRRAHGYPTDLAEGSSLGDAWIEMRQIRVLVGQWGPAVRLSAPELDLVVDGQDFTEAWAAFLRDVTRRSDSAWLTFDVGSLREKELHLAMDASEEETWACADEIDEK
ncbi:MAG: hypothetical protein QUV05_05115 [Phycisphaerae bacterium]|jgi:hypothetical protein|nr:hypothetical protein [Phycisphaerae bacterium]